MALPTGDVVDAPSDDNLYEVGTGDVQEKLLAADITSTVPAALSVLELNNTTNLSTNGFLFITTTSEIIRYEGISGAPVGVTVKERGFGSTSGAAATSGDAVWQVDASYYHDLLSAYVQEILTGNRTFSGTKTFSGATNFAEYIYHQGDADTFFRFQADQFTLHAGGVDFLNAVEAGTDYLQLLAGLNFINETANTKMTIGLTIMQDGNDDEIFTVKSSDVAHGMTDVTEADSYGVFKKMAATSGGLYIRGLKDAGGDPHGALVLESLLGEAADTVKTTAGHGVTRIIAWVTDGGTGVEAVGADGNLCTIESASTTRFIFDAEGSAHADVEWIAFQNHDDMALLDALEAEFEERGKPDGVPGEHVALLQQHGLINFYDDGPRAMLNTTRLNMLLVGTHRQTDKRIKSQDNKLNAQENKLAAMENRLAALENRP